MGGLWGEGWGSGKRFLEEMSIKSWTTVSQIKTKKIIPQTEEGDTLGEDEFHGTVNQTKGRELGRKTEARL